MESLKRPHFVSQGLLRVSKGPLGVSRRHFLVLLEVSGGPLGISEGLL